MKLTREPEQFTPITIRIESLDELLAFMTSLNLVSAYDIPDIQFKVAKTAYAFLKEHYEG